MEKLILNVEENTNERLDIYVSNKIDKISRSYIKKLIKDELIKVNNKKVKASYIIKVGDMVEVIIPKLEELEIEPENIDLEILYEDSDIAIINKQQEIVVHPAPGNSQGTLVNALLYHMDSLSDINGDIRPGIVHRLDKDTSGLLIIAKNNISHEILAKSLKDRNIERKYIALVHGILSNKEGVINAPIGRHKTDRKKMAVTKLGGKEAISHYKVLTQYNKYALVEVSLETGRTHQIRVHMAYINHPVVGDPVYNKRKNNFNLEKQMLHAYKLSFIHPLTKRKMEFETKVPKYFKEILSIIENKGM